MTGEGVKPVLGTLGASGSFAHPEVPDRRESGTTGEPVPVGPGFIGWSLLPLVLRFGMPESPEVPVGILPRVDGHAGLTGSSGTPCGACFIYLQSHSR